VADDVLDAVGFLTRIPVGRAELGGAGLSRAALWFPLVGLLVGGVAAGVRVLGATVLPADAATVLALAAAVVLTGALHEDALADTADALGAHTTRERRLEIMRDPRVGACGALAVVFAVLLSFVLLAPLSAGDFARAAVAAHVLARWTTLPLAWLVSAARADGAGALLRPGAVTVLAATAATVAATLLVAGVGAGAAALAVALLLTAAAGLAARRLLSGTTGDTLGATVKVVEVATYATLVAAW
jgi:adenosylcobinamide-GDP ribazoletransferase